MTQAIKIRGKQRKTETVDSIKEKLTRTKTFFVTEYRGLTHQQMEQLRRALKKVEAEYLVAKNTLLKLALDNSKIKLENIKTITDELKNPTATFFAFGDEIAAIKTLAQFIKNVQLPKIKIGFFDGITATEADFNKLATLPTMEVLLATLVVRLKSPIYGLHYAMSWNLRKLVTVLGNIKEKKPAAN